MSEALRIAVQFRGAELMSRTLTADCILIGRESNCELRLNHPDVSRFHACIVRSDHLGYVLRDLDSSNGTFVRGELVSAAPIRHGGQATIAEFTLDFQLVEVPWIDSEEPHSSVMRLWEQDTLNVEDTDKIPAQSDQGSG